MKRRLQITAEFDEPPLLEKMVERLAWKRFEPGYSTATVPPEWKAVDTSSTEIYASGTVDFIISSDECWRMPFVTSFFFTCTKEKHSDYDLEWSMSLS